MTKKLVQHNEFTHTTEDVKLPKSKNTLEDWKGLFNAQAPLHITYDIEARLSRQNPGDA